MRFLLSASLRYSHFLVVVTVSSRVTIRLCYHIDGLLL
nr:MAG TPA: glycoprotein [Caudoviricetes sp.]